VISRYSDFVFERALITSEDGRDVYCPYGLHRQGYYIPTPELRQQARNATRNEFIAAVLSGIVLVELGAVFAIPAWLIFHIVGTRRLIARLERSEARLSWREALERRASRFGWVWHWVTVAFVLGGLWFFLSQFESAPVTHALFALALAWMGFNSVALIATKLRLQRA
jgi:hypothetical protein